MEKSPELLLAEKARRAFKVNYARILQEQKAFKDLSDYQSTLSAISLNKSIMMMFVPSFAIGLGAVHYKYPKSYTDYKTKAIYAVAVVCLITNYRAFSAQSKLPDLESRLIDKYVIHLPEQQLDRYSNPKHTFPGAR